MIVKKRLIPMLAAALMAAPVAALADPTYSVSFLPDGFTASFLGNNGLVSGSMLTGSGTSGAIYQGGSLTQYGSLGITNITGVNSGGMFTGTLQTGSSMPHAFIYHSGTVDDLGTDGQQYAYGVAINASGQMAGQWINGPYGGAFGYSGGVITNIGDLGGSGSLHTDVSAINDAGVMVGSSLPSAGTLHAYMYSGGVMTDLGTPLNWGSGASAINNSGDIVGNIWDWLNDGPSHAFMYTGGVLHDLGTFGGDSAYASGINDSGLMVGSVGSASGGWGFLYSSGSAVDLNTLVTGASGWTIQRADAINDAGQILGWACDGAGACRDVVLDPISCVPEPATYAMLLAGLAGLAVRRRRALAADRPS
jgi:probable HAF family extracellular repeat protein